MNKFAIFIAGNPGHCLIDMFESSKSNLFLTVLDEADLHGQNERFKERLKDFPDNRILWNNDLKDPDVISEIKAMELDLAIMISWGYKIKEPLLSVPKKGFLNGHPSYLPYCRGKHPHFWCLQEGVPAGGTLHLIDEEFDKGKIVFQKEAVYDWTDTGGSLYHKSWKAVYDLFLEHREEILRLELNGHRAESPDEKHPYHFAKDIGLATEIDLDKTYTARELLNLLRGRTFPPYPAAYFSDNDSVYEVRVQITKKDDNKPNLT